MTFKCSRCGGEVSLSDTLFTSPSTLDFVCRRCFVEEVGRKTASVKIPNLSSLLNAETTQTLKRDDTVSTREETQFTISSPARPTINSVDNGGGNRKPVGKVRLYGVLYYKRMEALTKDVNAFRKYYEKHVENIPASSPSQVDLKVRYNGDGQARYLLVVSTELDVGGLADPKTRFTEFVREVTGKELKNVSYNIPENLSNTMPKASYHFGHMRLTDYLSV
jgi:hypothetical protein